jgi:hypothetical protein
LLAEVSAPFFYFISSLAMVETQEEFVSGLEFDLSSYTVKPFPKVEFIPFEEMLALVGDVLLKINPD